jgi:hypothetical protein
MITDTSPLSETSAEGPALVRARVSTLSASAGAGEYPRPLTPCPPDREALGTKPVQLAEPTNFTGETRLSLITPIRSRSLLAGSLARRRSRRRHWEPSDA